MEVRVLKELTAVIRTEQRRRAALLKDEDPDFAYDQWLFNDEPLLNELCLMFLVTLRHQIERELVWLAALAADGGKEIDEEKYKEREEELRAGTINWNWKRIEGRLKFKACAEYQPMEVLRLLSNSYKHDLSVDATEELRTLLRLDTRFNYATLPESGAVREAIAVCVGLGKDSGYWDIAERYVDLASSFLADIQSRTQLSQIKRKPSVASMNPDDFLR
jgi:hypothetical protein